MDNQRINKLICHEVMGWNWVEKLNSWVAGQGGSRYIVADHTYSPSTNLFDAWRVVERVRQTREIKGEKVRLMIKLTATSTPDHWMFTVTNYLNNEVLTESQALTPSKAICLGALGTFKLLQEVVQ